MYTLAEQTNIICFEKMVYRLGIVLMVLAVFSGQNMPIDAYGTANVLKGYIQENNTMRNKSENALFLLKKQWYEDLNIKYGKNNVKNLDDGIVYVSQIRTINSRRVKINISEVNRNINPDIEIKPELALNKMHSKSKIYNIANQSNAVLAVNGTYFKQDTGTPLGTLVIDNEIISGPIYDRAAMGISKNGYKTAKISFNGNITNGNIKLKIDNINQPRMLFTQVLLYSPKWGELSGKTNKPSKHIAIRNNRITAISSYPLKIPQDGYVVSMPIEKASGFNLGDKIELDYSIYPEMPDMEHIISGGPYLMKEGNIYVDALSEKLTSITGLNPRTAIGYTRDNVMIIVTVDGRKEGSTGVTLNELAYVMKSLGCYEAINLDGGSSTVMFAGGKVISGTNIKDSVALSNALVVRLASK